ncbi:uncharacterized protein LOC131174022 [Hevea brasiliensis]|uniref:uncharacterized protein LOC131174022 n=1 Tax=Hevea brasiliensis TaxID=3981 RepID=UPI0025D8BC3C|nr:uncharacterized protein LOC131174022 [Hevea brasiliensis]
MAVQQNSMGCVLGQHDDMGRKERAIYYLSKKFNDCESRYSFLEKTYCALAWTENRLKHYMLNHKTWLISRMDPIKYVFKSPFVPGRIAKWQVILSQYDIVYMTRKAVKGSIIADLLAENPIQDYEALDFKFPNEHVNEVSSEDKEAADVWEIYFDGAVNLSGNGIGAVLISLDGKHFPIAIKLRWKRDRQHRCCKSKQEVSQLIVSWSKKKPMVNPGIMTSRSISKPENTLQGQAETKEE